MEQASWKLVPREEEPRFKWSLMLNKRNQIDSWSKTPRIWRLKCRQCMNKCKWCSNSSNNHWHSSNNLRMPKLWHLILKDSLSLSREDLLKVNKSSRKSDWMHNYRCLNLVGLNRWYKYHTNFTIMMLLPPINIELLCIVCKFME